MKITYQNITELQKNNFDKFYADIKDENIEKQEELCDDFTRNRGFSVVFKENEILVCKK